MYLTTTGIVQAYLTQTGRKLLADNSAQFSISHFRFSDDEINYSLFDGSTEEAPNTDIMNLPILETTTLDTIPAQRNEIFSALPGNLSVAWIDTDIGRPFVDGGQLERPYRESANLFLRYNTPDLDPHPRRTVHASFFVKTLYGYDDVYHVRSSNTNVISVLSVRQDSNPDNDPYFVRHNQSKAQIDLAIAVKPSTQISIDPTLIPAKRPADLDTQPIQSWIQARGVAAVDSNSTGQRIGPKADIREDGAETTNQLIPVFSQLKVAHSAVQIIGSQSKKTFTVNVFVYTPPPS